jgi:alpha-amylase
MVGNGNDMFTNHCSGGAFWGNKNSSGGSPFYTQGFAYQVLNSTGLRPGNEFPQVPYGPMDFHCARGLGSWTDPFILNYGWLVNLVDLNTEKEYVRQRIADYITDLLGLGISGIRIDAAKHISPDNLAHIFKKLKTNLGGGDLPDDFTAYLEVIIGGEASLLMCQDNSYNYG